MEIQDKEKSYHELFTKENVYQSSLNSIYLDYLENGLLEILLFSRTRKMTYFVHFELRKINKAKKISKTQFLKNYYIDL